MSYGSGLGFLRGLGRAKLRTALLQHILWPCYTSWASRPVPLVLRRQSHPNAYILRERALWRGFSSVIGVTIAARTRGGYMIASSSTLAATTSSWTSIRLILALILSKPSKRLLGPVMYCWS